MIRAIASRIFVTFGKVHQEAMHGRFYRIADIDYFQCCRYWVYKGKEYKL